MKNNSKMFCKVQQQSFLTVTNDRCTNNNIMDLNFTLLTSFPRRLKLEKSLENRLDFRPLFFK